MEGVSGMAGKTDKRPAAVIMLQGTASDAGKSVLAAALCRIFRQDGRRVAPFKSQNMSLNSYVTLDGKEIGRAQGMQADACGIVATTDMNPILLKPKKDMAAQVVVHGKPAGDWEAGDYQEQFLPGAERIVKEALNRLRAEYDIVVMEGAGSPAEINLKDRDIANMRMAAWADAPVILVADIDRGGVFASVVGTMEILAPEERARVRGVIINKFRGDLALLQPGIEWLERRIGKPVLGVVPFLDNLLLEDEDAASLDRHGNLGVPGRTGQDASRQLDIAVIRLPRMSNYTDFDPLALEPGVRVRYVRAAREWGEPDAVVLPGSKNTVEDLRWLRESGLAALLHDHIAHGGCVTGICAGYQMMGRRLLDPDLVESDEAELEGLDLFPMETVFAREKETERVTGILAMDALGGTAGTPVEGYEIHMGQTRFLAPVASPFRLRSVRSPDEPASYHADGVVSEDGRLWGTYLHGIFHNDLFRHGWLNALRSAKGLAAQERPVPFHSLREQAFDRLADHVRRHVDMTRIYAMIAEQGWP